METSISFFVLAGIAAVFMSILWLSVFLLRANAKLRRDYQYLLGLMASQGNDLAGLCSAGVNMDRLLLDHDQRLRECQERIESLRVNEAVSHPYHAAIEKIRKGAEVQDLVAEFGLSLSEASLLARLHRFSGQSSDSEKIS